VTTLSASTLSELVVKASQSYGVAVGGEKRLTLAPLYSPDRSDAHKEWTDAGTLEDAAFAYAKSGDKRLLLQHGDKGTHYVGDVLAVFPWPQEAVMKMQKPGGGVVDHTFPAGTVWVWSRWSPDAWPLVKSGALGGLSMGGRALRSRTLVGGPTANMGYKVAVGKAGRVLSAQNVKDLLDTILILEAIVAREPDRTMGKCIRLDAGTVATRVGAADWIIASESMQKVFRFTPGEIETLVGED
jgi:Putative phage serine protease XkdF